MKNWKFIKTGNELPNDAEIKYKGYIIRYYPYQGKYLVEHRTDFSKTNPFIGKKFSTSEEAIREIEKLSVGNRKTRNESILTKDGLVNYPDKEIGEINILKRELEGLMRMAEKDKSTDYSKQIEALKKEISEKKNKYALGNKIGNQSAQDKFLDDINGIKAKYKQEGKELNLSRLMYELKRIGWSESDFTKLKWPANIGNASLGKFLMDGGHTATLVEEGGKFIVKYDDGSTETFMTRKAAEAYLKAHSELYIGNKKTGNKRYFSVEEEGGNSQNFSSLSEARSFADKWRSEGKQTVHIFEIEENDKDPDDFRVVRTINSSIEKQTWSMFKGLSKDAEKEIGNDSIGDEYNAEIYRLEKKKMDLERMGQGQKAREIEKQIQQLQKELREYDIGNKKTGNEKISYPPEKLKDVSWVTLQYIIIHPEKYDEKTVELAKKIYADHIGNKKTGNARPKEQLLADVRELTKYIQEHPGQSCEKEKRLLGEAKEELDKEYGILVNDLKRARNSIKTKNSDVTLWNGNDTAYIKEDGHVQFLENNAFLVEEDKYDSQEQAVEDLTKKGYRKK